MKKFNELPGSIQDEIKKVALYFEEVNVTFEYGKYNVSSGIGIKRNYADDYEYIGSYKITDTNATDDEIVKAREEMSKCCWF